MQYKCPNCALPREVQIVNTYPPRKMKCIHCGYQGVEQQFEVKNYGQNTKTPEFTSAHTVHNELYLRRENAIIRNL